MADSAQIRAGGGWSACWSRELSAICYDLVVPLGQWCGVALWCRKLGLRSASLPFDWLWGGNLSFRQYVDVVATEFNAFFQRENMVLERRGSEDPDELDAHDIYRDVVTGLHSCHDFIPHGDFAREWPAVRETYNRRIARLLGWLQGGGKVLFVHFARSKCLSVEEIQGAVVRLRTCYPRTRIDFLIIEENARFEEPQTEAPLQGVIWTRGRYHSSGTDGRYGNKELCRRVFDAIRVHGKHRNLIRLRLLRWKNLLCRHLRKSKNRRLKN